MIEGSISNERDENHEQVEDDEEDRVEDLESDEANQSQSRLIMTKKSFDPLSRKKKKKAMLEIQTPTK